MIDSGAGTDVLDLAPYRKIANIVPIEPTSMKLYPYGSNKEFAYMRTNLCSGQIKGRTNSGNLPHF